jgi:hypothetical protein
MYKRYRNARFYCAMLTLLLVALTATSVFAASGFGKLENASVANPELQKKLEMAKANERFLGLVSEKLNGMRQHEAYLQKIRNYPAGEKISIFLAALEQAKKQGFDTHSLLQSLTKQRNNALLKGGIGGNISGTVTVEGATPDDNDFIDVLAFDEFGFPAGVGTVSLGTYVIFGLAPGDYYVVTQGPFVDEFYDNVPADFFRNWRDATLLTVSDEGAAVANFDLERGALVTGTVTNADGGAPLGDAFVDFVLVNATDPVQVFNTSAIAGEDGFYEMHLPGTGAFIIQASVEGFFPQFYDNANTPAEATPVVVASLDAEVNGIDFSLSSADAPIDEGAKIRGTVLDTQATPLPLAFVFAFDVADTSIAGLGITGLEDGTYEIGGLEEGHSYVLFANHFLEFVFELLFDVSGLSFVGEYYENSPTPDGATALAVTATDTLFEGVDFTLEPGGAIAGNITDANGAALEGMLVIGFKTDLLQTDNFFAENIDLSISFTDSAGDYALAGLSSGNYLLRTVSLLGPDLGTGSHAGLVLDEYYDNVQGLFDIAQATLVAVQPPETTADIDFELDLAGGISGSLTELDGTTSIQASATLVAFNAETGFPELALSAFDIESGAYEIRPLASGSYFLLAFTVSNAGEPIYVPQFFQDSPTMEDGTPIEVTTPNNTENVNFNMVRAGGLVGVVNIAPQFPVGADSLSNTFVAAFETSTGRLAGTSNVTFAGAYQILGLGPGFYKVGAFAGVSGYSVTYSGGGGTFDDANSMAVSVDPDELSRADILLIAANGEITGTVSDLQGSPISGVLVLAYDPSGHAVAAGLSGFDFATGEPLANPGEYRISGLRTGNYFVRTFALYRLFSFVQDFNLPAGGDFLSIIMGLLQGGFSDLFDLNIDLYADVLYRNHVVQFDFDRDDLFALLFNLILSNGDIQGLLPLVLDPIPVAVEVEQVAVVSPNVTAGISFALPRLGDNPTDVTENPGESLPTSFDLAQNYPNPFNPSTVIGYKVPTSTQIKLSIFNVLGQQIQILFDGIRPAGSYSTVWDGRNQRGEVVSAGIYFVRMESGANNLVLTRKMVFVK